MRAGANEYLAWPLDRIIHAAIRRAAERSRPKDGTRNCSVLSFFGVKGGAGTTTLAVNSAIEIARTSKKPTLIIDLHQFIGEVALFLGVRPRFTLVDALDNLHRIDAEFLRELVVKHKTGLDILAGGEQADRPGPQDAVVFEQLLQTLGRSYDYIIIDGGLVTGPCSDVAVFAADSIYLVANPDIACVRNAHRVVDRMGQLGANRDRLRMLLNRMSDQHEIGPKQIESTLGFSLFSVFPSDYSHGVGGAQFRRAAHAEQSLGAGGAVRHLHQTNRVSKSDQRRRRTAAGACVVPGALLNGRSRHRSDTTGGGPARPRPSATPGARSTSRCAAPCTASC